jgi:hypothetical protein
MPVQLLVVIIVLFCNASLIAELKDKNTAHRVFDVSSSRFYRKWNVLAILFTISGIALLNQLSQLSFAERLLYAGAIILVQRVTIYGLSKSSSD